MSFLSQMVLSMIIFAPGLILFGALSFVGLMMLIEKATSRKQK